jgi:hypothetical protein
MYTHNVIHERALMGAEVGNKNMITSVNNHKGITFFTLNIERGVINEHSKKLQSSIFHAKLVMFCGYGDTFFPWLGVPF